ncbi:TPA: hypothetical protein OB549_002295 [Escherichia coli]|nr:hypothetical protein [Escherichia coli]
MKLLIAIIMMVLAGNCFAEPGDYRLNADDNARFESIVIEECEKTAVFAFGDILTRDEVEYVAAVCKPVAFMKIYERFDDIAAIHLKERLKEELKEDSDPKINILKRMGETIGDIVADQYLGMSFE